MAQRPDQRSTRGMAPCGRQPARRPGLSRARRATRRVGRSREIDRIGAGAGGLGRLKHAAKGVRRWRRGGLPLATAPGPAARPGWARPPRGRPFPQRMTGPAVGIITPECPNAGGVSTCVVVVCRTVPLVLYIQHRRVQGALHPSCKDTLGAVQGWTLGTAYCTCTLPGCLRANCQGHRRGSMYCRLQRVPPRSSQLFRIKQPPCLFRIASRLVNHFRIPRIPHRVPVRGPVGSRPATRVTANESGRRQFRHVSDQRRAFLKPTYSGA